MTKIPSGEITQKQHFTTSYKYQSQYEPGGL